MQVSRKVLIDIIALLAIVLIAVIGYRLSPLLLPKADVSAVTEPGCNLHQHACTAKLLGGGRIELSLMPRPIPLIQPVKIEVKTTGIDEKEVRKVVVDFAGVSMNMGFNRPELVTAGSGVFRGETTLPVCITGNMAWQATVLIETGHERIAAAFRFNSEHD